ncbi:MAG: hypothetical protein K1X44_08775, partial [Alphaproteobacteria bacterium]|nr:hypothetical protein [Alphaproteobacteria bacterium]
MFKTFQSLLWQRRFLLLRFAFQLKILFFLSILGSEIIGHQALAKYLTPNDLSLTQKAFAEIDKKQWKNALATAARIKNPIAQDLIEWLDLIRPDSAFSFERLNGFLSTHPNWPSQNTLRIKAEMAITDILSPDFIIKWFSKYDPLTLVGSMKLAEAMFAKKMDKQAISMLRNGWIKYNGTESVEADFIAYYKNYLQPSDHNARLDRLLWDENLEAAERMLPFVDQTQQVLARTRISLINNSINGVNMARTIPANIRTAGLMYDLARWYRSQDQFPQAAQSLDPPPNFIPRPELFWPQLDNAARRALVRGDYQLAYRLAQGHGAPSGISFAEGEWLAGWIALSYLHDAKRAFDHFTKLYNGVLTALSRSRAAYWAGLAADKMGDKATAQKWYNIGAAYPSAFYGQLSTARLNTKSLLNLSVLKKSGKTQKAAFDQGDLTKAILILNDVSQEKRMQPFFLKLADMAESEEELQMIADLAKSLALPKYSLMVAKQGRNKG